MSGSDGEAPRRAGPMRRRSLVGGPLVVGLLALVIGALVLAGADDRRDRAFSLQVPAALPVVTVKPGQRICQSPIISAAGFSRLAIFLSAPPEPGARLQLQSVLGGRASAWTAARPTAASTFVSFSLDRTVPAGASIEACLRNVGTGSPTLLGAAPNTTSGELSANGHRLGSAAAMEALAPHSHSLLASLPEIFTRASLFRPTWVAPWVYWVLIGLLLAGMTCAVAGLLAAASADAASTQDSSR